MPVVQSPTLPMSEEELEALEEELDLPEPIEIPDASRRPIDLVGPLGPREWGLGVGAFGDANGRYLSTLMRRLDAPLPSRWTRSEEHTSELQSLMRISYAVFCLKKKKKKHTKIL